MAPNLDYSLTYVKVKKQVGLPRVRNIGIQHSNYNFIGFLDDDCSPIRKDLLKRAYKWLNLKKYNIVGVGGPIYYKSNEPHYIISKIRGFKSFFNIKQLFKLFLEIIETQNYKTQKLVFVNSIRGGNSFFRKDFLEKCGGFDPEFDGNYYREDTDVCLSLKKQGKLVSDPKMPVNHMHIKYSGCRRKADEFYSNILSNSIFLIMKHKKILIEVFLDIIFNILGIFKLFITSLDNENNKINRYNLLISCLTGFVLGFKKYFFPKKNFTPPIIEKKVKYPKSPISEIKE